MSKSLENSLIQTIKKSDLKELPIELGEVALDQFIKSEVIKEIPVIGVISKIIKAGVSIRDYYFVKKLLMFIKEFDKIDINKRQVLVERMYKDFAYNEKVGEYIIMIIDRMDETQKVYYISKAFIEYLNGQINVIQLQRIANSINQTLMVNLDEVKQYYNEENFETSPDIIHNLANSGLVNLGSAYGGEILPERNTFGQLFYEHVLKDK